MKRPGNVLFSVSVIGLSVGGFVFSGGVLDSALVDTHRGSIREVSPAWPVDSLRAPSGNDHSDGRAPDLARSVPTGDTGQVIRDIVYGHGDGMPLLLDLYLPEATPRPYPAMIFIFNWGGGGQARRHFAPHAAYLAERGIASSIISYRSAGPATFPAAIEDCKAAVRWMRAHAEEYGFHPGKIVAVGGSAGGQLAALLGTSGGLAELEGTGGNSGYSSDVNLVIVFFGIFDLAELYRYSLFEGDVEISGILEAYVGGTPEQSPLEYELASAIRHVDEADPPTLLIHGTSDELVPFGQSVRFKETLEAVGVPVELFAIEGAKHGFRSAGLYFRETVERMEGFIDKYLR